MYPIYSPYKHFLLTVDHIGNIPIQLYIELCGNPQGIPVIYLHGGPGDKDDSELRSLFNPNLFNLILFDQRGCGRSKPRNHLKKNTTQLLLKDIDTIREYLKIPKMVVTGGSWGSSLAVLYAEEYPKHVSALVLRGFFNLVGDDDVLSSMDPETNDKIHKLLRLSPNASSKTMFRKQHKVLHSRRKTRKKLIELLNGNEIMYAVDPVRNHDTFRDQETLALIGNHYELNDYFVKKNQLMDNLHKLPNIPISVITGKSDIITPPYMAYEFYKKTKCRWKIVRGGHTFFEKTIAKAFKDEMDRLGRHPRKLL